jgi:hypothetical protein
MANELSDRMPASYGQSMFFWDIDTTPPIMADRAASSPLWILVVKRAASYRCG